MKKRQFITGLLAGVLVLSSVGCSISTGGKTSGSDLTIWYEAATVKYQRNDAGEAAKSAKDKDVLKINMARNESEGVQLMMYAKKDVASYNVSISDLKSENGIIEAEQVDIYHVFYQTASGNQKPGNPEFATGEIPDPMLPIETAVEYKETSIQKGNNQVVYLDVTTTKDTLAGVYEGEVTVVTENDEYQMPIEVTVYDVVYPDTAELKTAFSYFGRDHFASAELSGTDEQTTAYFETLLDFNMSSALPYEGVGGIDKYLELLKQYYDAPGFNSYRLYYKTDGGVYNGQTVTYNVELLKEYIIAIAKMSVEDKVNYLDKAYAYFYTVADEPSSEEQFLTAKAALDAFNVSLRDADTELRGLYAGTDKYDYYTKTVSDTLLNIEEVLPGNYDIEDAKKYGLDNLTFVPEISYLNSESDRYYYTNGREDRALWTYSCWGPAYPFPSGHTDDYILGFRLTSWMCHDYGLEGYLMWAVADYLYMEDGEVMTDPWETMDTGQGRPGDGKLFYPGEKYGLDNPCPSLRAMAYRDGVDDYSLLQAVAEIYESYDLDAASALQPIYDSLFSGVIPITDTYVFEAVREELFKMVGELQSDVGILYKDVEVALDKASFSFKTVNEEAIVEADGKTLAMSEDGFYHVDVDLTEQSEYTFTVTYGDASKEYTRTLLDGILGKVEGFENVNDIDSYIFSTSTGYEATINEDAAFVNEGNKSVHISINKEKKETLPYFAIAKDSELIGGSWKGIESIKFYVYNPGSEEVSMDATYYTVEEVSVGTYKFVPGQWTLVEIAMPQNIKDVEKIQEFDFNFENGSCVELYLDSFATVAVEE